MFFAPLPHFPSFQVAHLTCFWEGFGETYMTNRQSIPMKGCELKVSDFYRPSITSEKSSLSIGKNLKAYDPSLESNTCFCPKKYGAKPPAGVAMQLATCGVGWIQTTVYVYFVAPTKTCNSFILRRCAFPAFPHLAALMSPLPLEVKCA